MSGILAQLFVAVGVASHIGMFNDERDVACRLCGRQPCGRSGAPLTV